MRQLFNSLEIYVIYCSVKTLSQPVDLWLTLVTAAVHNTKLMGEVVSEELCHTLELSLCRCHCPAFYLIRLLAKICVRECLRGQTTRDFSHHKAISRGLVLEVHSLSASLVLICVAYGYIRFLWPQQKINTKPVALDNRSVFRKKLTSQGVRSLWAFLGLWRRFYYFLPLLALGD